VLVRANNKQGEKRGGSVFDLRASPYRMEKEKNLGLFFFLAKCFQSMPKKEKFSQKKSERAQ
jgi:hypothetical protein